MLSAKGGSVRRWTLAAGLVLVAVLAAAQTVEVTFVNRTGSTIYYLYASGSDADSWGNDLLGNRVLPDGDVFRARLRTRSDSIDVLAEDANGNEYIVWGWNTGESQRVVLRTSDYAGSRPASASSDAISWISIVNDTNYDIQEIYVAPAYADSWDDGEQVLQDGDFVYDGEDTIVEVDTDRYGTFIVDVMLVDVDGDTYIKWDVNLEFETEIVFTLDDLVWR
jgi:hypothetical protein